MRRLVFRLTRGVRPQLLPFYGFGGGSSEVNNGQTPRETFQPMSFPLLAAPELHVWLRHSIWAREFLGELTPAKFSDIRTTPRHAASLLTAEVFLSARFLRAHILLNRAYSPFLQERFRANRGALTQKRGSACANIYNIYSFSYRTKFSFHNNKRTAGKSQRFYGRREKIFAVTGCPQTDCRRKRRPAPSPR